MSDKIIIKNLNLFSNHGYYEEEKKLGQHFLIDIDVSLDAVDDDDLNRTVSYSELCDFVSDIFCSNTFDLIESCSDFLATEILIKYIKINEVKVTVKKVNVPMANVLDYPASVKVRKRHLAFIALGSNIGDGEKNLKDAIDLLNNNRMIRVCKKSAFFKTKPWGKTDQPDFYNAAIEIETIYEPKELLDVLLTFEKLMGRVRKEKWGSRIIDLDIIFFDDLILYTDDLKIPHPYANERLFVMKPLLEIAPFFIDPVSRLQIRQICQKLENENN